MGRGGRGGGGGLGPGGGGVLLIIVPFQCVSVPHPHAHAAGWAPCWMGAVPATGPHGNAMPAVVELSTEGPLEGLRMRKGLDQIALWQPSFRGSGGCPPRVLWGGGQ